MYRPLQMICLSAVIAFSVKAQEPLLEIKLSSDSITLGNFFTMQVVLKNAKECQFVPPAFSQAIMEEQYFNEKSNENEEYTTEWIFRVYPYYEGRYLIPKMLFKLSDSKRFEIQDIAYYVFPVENSEDKTGVVDIKAPKSYTFEKTITRKKKRSRRSKDKSNAP